MVSPRQVICFDRSPQNSRRTHPHPHTRTHTHTCLAYPSFPNCVFQAGLLSSHCCPFSFVGSFALLLLVHTRNDLFFILFICCLGSSSTTADSAAPLNVAPDTDGPQATVAAAAASTDSAAAATPAPVPAVASRTRLFR